MKNFRRFCAILLGIVFVVSGLMKLQDPVGTMLVVTEYFKFFRCPFLIPVAKLFGQLLSLFEATLGVALITGVLRKLAAWCTYLLLGIFSVLTLILWIKNPAMDCGCFGEALHLTHAQSFWKNIVLLALSLLAFAPISRLGKPIADRWVAAGVGFVSLLVAMWFCNRHLPVVDFTAFNWGAELFAALDDNDEVDFDRHPILGFRDAQGNYQDSRAAEGKAIVFSVYDLPNAPWEQLQQQYHMAEAAGGTPLLLLASDPSLPEAALVPAHLTPYFADYKTLITLNRSNGGGSYLNRGVIVHKWASADFPSNLAGDLATDPVDLSTRKIIRRRIRAQGFLLYLTAVLILL